jgi:NTE family protein
MTTAIHCSTIAFSVRTVKLILVVFLFIQPGSIVFPQQAAVRPKVGLALSGGGSLGIAHLGVIKVMEEAGLRPDYITGVSMGSIIGGMYAIGYNSDSILNILRSMDWDLIFTSNIPENKVVFPEKEHFSNSIIAFPVTSKKFQMPSGLINGQQIENQLSYYAWPAVGINDFFRLPIPFMCIGSDILTGKIVHLKTGYLPQAIRASIAVPTIFTPVKIDTALLTDGGVLRNYAAEELRNMGADIVIGSYTGFQIYTEEELQSLPGIIKQIAFLSSLRDFESQKKFTDLLIEPRVKGFSSTVFTIVDTIYERGYKAALPHKEYFKKLADSLNSIGPQKPLENILDRQIYSIDKIEISGNKLYYSSQILGILDIEPGDKIGKNYITDKIDLLYGKGWFENIQYRILSRNDSLILFIDCKENPKIMLFGGVYYDNYIRSGLILRTTFKDLLVRNSFIDFDFFLGQYYRAKLTILQYIDRNQKLGISAGIYFNNTLLPFLNIKNESGSVLYRNNYAGVNLNRYLGLNHMMNISVSAENVSFEPDFVSENNLKKETFNSLAVGFNYQVNTLDTKNFPNKGILFRLSAVTSKLFKGIIRSESIKNTYKENDPGDFSFNRTYAFLANFRNYFPAGRKLTLSFKGDMLFRVDPGSDSSLQNLYYLGGLEPVTCRSVPVVGFLANEIPVTKFAGAGMDFDIEIFNKVHLSMMTSVFAAKEVRENEKISLLGGYGIDLGYMSIIGPLRVGLMHGLSSTKRQFKGVKSYISIGYSF